MAIGAPALADLGVVQHRAAVAQAEVADLHHTCYLPRGARGAARPPWPVGLAPQLGPSEIQASSPAPLTQHELAGMTCTGVPRSSSTHCSYCCLVIGGSSAPGAGRTTAVLDR
jgi:hypothetical protein